MAGAKYIACKWSTEQCQGLVVSSGQCLGYSNTGLPKLDMTSRPFVGRILGRRSQFLILTITYRKFNRLENRYIAREGMMPAGFQEHAQGHSIP